MKHTAKGVTVLFKTNRVTRKIREAFPQVIEVYDALEGVRIDVSAKDRKGAEPQRPDACAFAKAACRTLKADGAYIGLKSSYVVFGKKAVRFSTPVTVSREIVSFDRHEDFASGVYRLSQVSPSQRLPRAPRRDRKRPIPKKNKDRLGVMHHTARIRE